MNTVNRYNSCFKSDLVNVKSKLKEILDFLSYSLPMHDDIKREFRLLYSELLCNAVLHGNKGNNNKTVYVDIEIKEGFAYSTIKDEGDGFNYRDFIKSILNRKDVSLMESGRGIWLVYALSDTVSFNVLGNEIKFVKRCSHE